MTQDNMKKEPHHDEENLSVNERLLRTVKYTGQTNVAIMHMANELLKLSRAQQKQGQMKMLFWFIPIVFMIGFYIKQHFDQQSFYDKDKGYVGQVLIKGAISMDSATASADTVIPALRAAFNDPKSKGVVLRISSPGGSPTQSILIHDELKKLQLEHPEKELVVIGEEGLTSGAYWIASAAPEIHALPATFTGSIGVIMTSFDLSKLAERLDVKRRIITAGDNKSRLDMFVEPRPEDIKKLKDLANQLHQQFISVVTESRGDRIDLSNKELFSGDFWLGEKALELGLIDSITSTSELLMKKFGTDTVRDYSAKPGFLDKLQPKFGLSMDKPGSEASSLMQIWNMMTLSEYPTMH